MIRDFDTSILAKLYPEEPNSKLAGKLVHELRQRAILTELHRLEIMAAFGQKHGRGEITAEEERYSLAAFESDRSSGFFREMRSIWDDVFATAERLARQHASATLSRSLDILHVASALRLGSGEFCTFDKRQALLAKASGLIVVTQ